MTSVASAEVGELAPKVTSTSQGVFGRSSGLCHIPLAGGAFLPARRTVDMPAVNVTAVLQRLQQAIHLRSVTRNCCGFGKLLSAFRVRQPLGLWVSPDCNPDDSGGFAL